MTAVPHVTIDREEVSVATAQVTLTVDLTDLPFDSDDALHLVLLANASNSSGSVGCNVQFNSDTGANYNSQYIRGNSSTDSAAPATAANAIELAIMPGGDSDIFGSVEDVVTDAFSGRSHKSLVTVSGAAENYVQSLAGRWASLAAITSVTFTAASNNWIAGSTFELAVADERLAIPGAQTIIA